jgi:hypothetical protein
MPGQLGPTMRDLFWVLSMSVMRTMSGRVSAGYSFQVCCAAVPCWGMPSVMLRRVSSCVGRRLRAHVRHNQRDLSLDGLLNAGGGDGGTVGLSDGVSVWVVWARVRDEDGGRGRASLPDALLDIGEDGEAEVLLAGLLGVGASDDLCACASTSIAALVAARRLFYSHGRVPYSMACRAWKLLSC